MIYILERKIDETWKIYTIRRNTDTVEEYIPGWSTKEWADHHIDFMVMHNMEKRERLRIREIEVTR